MDVKPVYFPLKYPAKQSPEDISGLGAILGAAAISRRTSMSKASALPSIEKQSKGLDITAYPLSAALTLRVFNYLNIFRLFISLALTFAYFTGGLTQTQAYGHPAPTIVSLAIYVVLSVFLFVEARRAGVDCFRLARNSLFMDILFLSLIFLILGGLNSGLGVLILLPLRMALFLASIATIAIIGEALLGGLARHDGLEHLLGAGFYGLIIFLTTVLTHLLAFWARDYRLIAERQQKTLTRLEQINELIIRRMRNGVLAVDNSGQIQMMNESAWFLLGNPAATDRMLAEVSPELKDAMESWRESSASDSEPVTLNASQAQVIPKFVSLPGEAEIRTLIFLEDNDVVAQRAIEMSASSLAKLSGSIAHEIRNPLAAVSHAAQLMGESDGIPEADLRLLSIIRNQARRMNGIVENILQLSRREKSRPELFELTSWLRDLHAEFSHSISAQEVEPGLVMPADDILVLWKLLENAVEHAGNEGAEAEITLRMDPEAETGYCVISVEDNGAGISADHIGNVFEPFYTTRRQGSGLGLYIARQLCEANQAELTVDSTPGWKTRFHIRAPLARVDPNMEARA
jgi:two-component system sensor histidine kinase PilS (NtrC family)